MAKRSLHAVQAIRGLLLSTSVYEYAWERGVDSPANVRCWFFSWEYASRSLVDYLFAQMGCGNT